MVKGTTRKTKTSSTLSSFENEILAMGRFLERVYDYNIYDKDREYIDTYLKEHKVDINNIASSKNVDLRFLTPGERIKYTAQAIGLMKRLLKEEV